MADKKMNMGDLYSFNQTIYKQLPPIPADEYASEVFNMGMWFSSRTDRKDFMFLCRELNDYTIFHFNAPRYDDAKEELKSLITSRGIPVAIDYNHDQDSYEVWVKRGGEVHMYLLFCCDDFMINIG